MTYQNIKTPSDDTVTNIAAVERAYSGQNHVVGSERFKKISFLGIGKAVFAYM